jgi:probable HAF family extracellular repeat protein
MKTKKLAIIVVPLAMLMFIFLLSSVLLAAGSVRTSSAFTTTDFLGGSGFLAEADAHTACYILTKVYPPAGYCCCEPVAINNKGQVIATCSNSSSGNAAFLYSHGKFTIIDDPSFTPGYTTPTGINDNGQVVGYYKTPSLLFEGFLYSGGHITKIIDPLGGQIEPREVRINNSGEVAGTYSSPNSEDELTDHGFSYSDGKFTTKIDVPEAYETVVQDINNSGQAVGWYIDPSNKSETHGFLYSRGKFTGFTYAIPHPEFGNWLDINDSGQVAGTYADNMEPSNNHGFLYKDGRITSVDVPGYPDTVVTGINSSGQIAGYATDELGDIQGFLYSGGRFITTGLETSDYFLGINDNGQIVGFSSDSLDYFFIATPAQPVAGFTESQSHTAPITVCFRDTSTGPPTKWSWDFGDNSRSNLENPCHPYAEAGNYTVTLAASNAYGSNTTSQVIAVNPTAPGPPTGVTATAGNASTTVTFTDPASDGGRPIIFYAVESNPGGVAAGGVNSPITVTGLTNGISYTFTVKAVNWIGEGPASNPPSNSVAPHK